MKKFGDSLKQIRTSREITQQQISSDLLDRTTISKIEHSTEAPNYENAITLINRLGVTPNEFEYIRREYSWNLKSEIIFAFINLAYNTEEDKINSILKKCNSLKKDADVNRISLILKALKMLNQKDGFLKAKEVVSPIWLDYLSKVETWTILDLYILNNIFFLFEEKTMNEITNQAIQVIINKYPFLKSLETNLLMNKAYLLMKQESFSLAIEYLKRALQLAKELLRYDKVILAKGRIAICLKNENDAKYYVQLLKEIEALQAAVGLQEEILEFNNVFEPQ